MSFCPRARAWARRSWHSTRLRAEQRLGLGENGQDFPAGLAGVVGPREADSHVGPKDGQVEQVGAHLLVRLRPQEADDLLALLPQLAAVRLGGPCLIAGEDFGAVERAQPFADQVQFRGDSGPPRPPRPVVQAVQQVAVERHPFGQRRPVPERVEGTVVAAPLKVLLALVQRRFGGPCLAARFAPRSGPR